MVLQSPLLSWGSYERMNDVAERVRKIVAEHLAVDEARVTEDASFTDDLGGDSLDAAELVIAFEEEFGCESRMTRPRRSRTSRTW
jgi:acyl carrier protein